VQAATPPPPRLVLYVENGEDEALLFERAVRRGGVGFELRILRSGGAALDYLRGHGEYSDRARFPLPQLVVLDWQMPGTPGSEVLRMIRANAETARTPVIVLSDSGAVEDIAESYQLAANCHVRKPLRVEDLLVIVRSFADEPGRSCAHLAPFCQFYRAGLCLGGQRRAGG
jgi:CheY-like chemotaxis protein